jgi:hypothetical protein
VIVFNSFPFRDLGSLSSFWWRAVEAGGTPYGGLRAAHAYD